MNETHFEYEESGFFRYWHLREKTLYELFDFVIITFLLAKFKAGIVTK
jgi:hypothetical protein